MNGSNRIVVTEDEFYRVEFHEELLLLYVLWKRHLEGDILREKYLHLLQIMDEYQPRGWLGNARALYYTTLQDSRWIFDFFVPSLFQSTIAKYARLETPQSLLILDSVALQDKINSLASENGDLEFRFFTDEEMAINWLSESQS